MLTKLVLLNGFKYT